MLEERDYSRSSLYSRVMARVNAGSTTGSYIGTPQYNQPSYSNQQEPERGDAPPRASIPPQPRAQSYGSVIRSQQPSPRTTVQEPETRGRGDEDKKISKRKIRKLESEAVEQVLSDGKVHIIVSPTCGFCKLQEMYISGAYLFKDETGHYRVRPPDPNNKEEMLKVLPPEFVKKHIVFHFLGVIKRDGQGRVVDVENRVLVDERGNVVDERRYKQLLQHERVSEILANKYKVRGFPTFIINPQVCNPKKHAEQCQIGGLRGHELFLEVLEKNRNEDALRDIHNYTDYIEKTFASKVTDDQGREQGMPGQGQNAPHPLLQQEQHSGTPSKEDAVNGGAHQ